MTFIVLWNINELSLFCYSCIYIHMFVLMSLLNEKRNFPQNILSLLHELINVKKLSLMLCEKNMDIFRLLMIITVTIFIKYELCSKNFTCSFVINRPNNHLKQILYFILQARKLRHR